jgi:hypothetical protein
MFSLPSAADELPEGASEKNPIVLEGVKHEAFESFLSVMYPSYVSPGKYSIPTADTFFMTETSLRATIKQWRIGQQCFLWHRDGNLRP